MPVLSVELARSVVPIIYDRSCYLVKHECTVGMSKSGLFAHFRSKEELQLATVEVRSPSLRRLREAGWRS